MAKLVINPGTPQAREFELKPGSNYVGRGFANDLEIADPSVSSKHAQIVVTNGTVTVKDLGSTNGTFINRSQVSEGVLQPGQLLRLGGVELVYQSDSAASATPVPVAVAATAQTSPSAEEDTIRIAANPSPQADVVAPAPGLRVAHAPVRAVAVADVPLPPPILAAAAGARKGGKSVCRFHPKSPATWMCPKCSALYCDLCVGTRPAGGGVMGHFCRPCGVQCSQVEVQFQTSHLEKGTFFTHLPKAFVYPFQRGGGFLLVCATIFFVVLSLLRTLPAVGGIFIFFAKWSIRITYYGYLYSYLQNVIHTTAHGDEHDPTLPDVSDFGQDLLSPAMQLISTIVLCFGLAIGFAAWGTYQRLAGDTPTALWGVIPAAILGCAYFPMAFLTVAMFDTVSAINPMIVVPAIFKMPLQYLVACAVMCVAAVAYWLGATLLPMAVVATGANSFVAILVTSPFTGFVWLYLLTVMSRILGLLYYKNKDELGWFRH